MFNRYFRPFVPGFHLRPENDVRGFNLEDDSFPSVSTWPYGMPSRPVAPSSSSTALVRQILNSSTPSPQLFARSFPPTGLAGFRAATQDDVPGFNLRVEDSVPGGPIEGDSGVPRQGTPWFDGTLPQSAVPTWPHQPPTMPLPWTAFDSLTGQRTAPYAAPYVDGTSAPRDPSTDAPPDAEEWPSADAEEWPSSDTEEWPASNTDAQSQTPSTVPARVPNAQQAVQQATWRIQPPAPMRGQVYSEIGGHMNLDDSRNAPMALPNLAAPWVASIADNNFVLANARNDAVREHAPSNRSSSFDQEPIFSVGLKDVVARKEAPATTGTRSSVVASFPAIASENAPYQSYGTNSARPTNIQYGDQPVGPAVAYPYPARNLPLQLANLSEVNNQGAPSSSASMSDAYPEPLIPGAQYAQVIQQNNVILGNPRIDRTTDRLLSILTETVESLGVGSGPIFGIEAHFEFAKRVRALNIPGIREEGVEQSFDVGRIVRYGLEGSVRTDIVLRDPSGIPIAIYDLKTGNAKLTPSRVQELRDAVKRKDIPVIELRYASGNAILR
ncbi:MAG: hypothetical protein ISP49_00360 [Reyranella sp.]|nr:hypothetical protein [Reyranella sp.]MBL6650014.1 hypothetical protein [Reyranella sp.]